MRREEREEREERIEEREEREVRDREKRDREEREERQRNKTDIFFLSYKKNTIHNAQAYKHTSTSTLQGFTSILLFFLFFLFDFIYNIYIQATVWERPKNGIIRYSKIFYF
jgi:hypothetical protein